MQFRGKKNYDTEVFVGVRRAAWHGGQLITVIEVRQAAYCGGRRTAANVVQRTSGDERAWRSTGQCDMAVGGV